MNTTTARDIYFCDMHIQVTIVNAMGQFNELTQVNSIWHVEWISGMSPLHDSREMLRI